MRCWEVAEAWHGKKWPWRNLTSWGDWAAKLAERHEKEFADRRHRGGGYDPGSRRRGILGELCCHFMTGRPSIAAIEAGHVGSDLCGGNVKGTEYHWDPWLKVAHEQLHDFPKDRFFVCAAVEGEGTGPGNPDHPTGVGLWVAMVGWIDADRARQEEAEDCAVAARRRILLTLDLLSMEDARECADDAAEAIRRRIAERKP